MLFQSATFISQSVTSDQNGMYRFPHLSSGQYELTVRKADFEEVRREVKLYAGESPDLSVLLPASEKKATSLDQTLTFDASSSLSPAAAQGTHLLSPDGGDGPSAVLGGLDAVQQFRIMNNYQPGPSAWMQNFRHPGSGMVHGSLYGMLGDRFVGSNRLQSPFQLPLVAYGAGFGGAFQHDRSSYFAAFDRDSLDQRRLVAASGKSVDGAFRLPESANAPVTSSQFLARIDHRLSERDSLYLRYKRFQMSGNSPQGDPQLPQLGLTMSQQEASIGNTYTVSPNTVNETRGRFIAGSAQVPSGLATS